MKTNRLTILLLAAVVMGACDKNAVQEENLLEPVVGNAMVKFFHFGVNGPGVNFYLNDEKVTGIQSTTNAELTTGTAFNGAAAGGFYTAHDPGQYTISGRIAAAVDKNLPISNLGATLEADKAYSYYLSGIYNATTKTQDSFIIEDVLPAIDYTRTCVRFVNAISNSQPMALYVRDVVSAVETKLGAETAYKAGTGFICGPAGIYDLNTRTAGSTTNAITRTAVTFAPGRVYTITARGDMTVTGTTATNRPLLDNTVNR
jgi:hypothetical protein